MAHTKHTRIARQLQRQLGIPYQQALGHVRAGRDRSLLAQTDTVHAPAVPERVYVVGFVTDSGTGGFEWRYDRADADELFARWVAEGEQDVSDVQEVALAQLLGAQPDATPDPDTVTAALNERPELWEPGEGQNRAVPADGFTCNPGHPDAVAAGCSCDPARNRHGQLAAGQMNTWTVRSGCRLHGLLAGWTARQARITG